MTDPSEEQEKITELQSLLQEKESDVIKAAEIGTALLQENSALKDRLDETVRKHGLQVEVPSHKLCEENLKIF